MSRGAKMVIGIAAAVAIPFAAPIIASAIGSSLAISAASFGMSTAVGATLGSAAVGGVLGGATQAALGGDVRRGALMGAIGGGIGGYVDAANAASAAAARPFSPYAADGSLSITGNGGLAPPPTFSPYAADGSLSIGGNAGLAPPTVAPTPVNAGLGSAMNPGTAPVVPDTTFGAPTTSTFVAPTDATTTAGLQPQTFMGNTQFTSDMAFTPKATLGSEIMPPAGGVPPTGGAQFATPNAPKSFTDTLVNKITDPEKLADLTLRAAGMLAGSAAAGDGLTDEERQLLDAQTEELRKLQQANAGLFAQRLEQAQNLIGESKYFDPEYFGLQSARRTQTTIARAKREGLRGLEGMPREATARRFDLANARETGTAYDRGYLTGVQGRLSTMQAGLSAMPTSYPSSATDYGAVRNAYDSAATRARLTQGDIGDLFGTVTGRQQSQSRGRN